MAKRKGPLASINPPHKHGKRQSAGRGGYLKVPYTGEAATGAQVPPGFVRFWPPGFPGHAVMVPMGDHGWVIPRASTWEGQTRPIGYAISAWRGMAAIEATVDVVFERWEQQQSVQPAVDLLWGLMNQGPNPVGSVLKPPPPVMVTRGSSKSKVSSPQDDPLRYAIVSIDPDEDECVVNDEGRFIRYEAVVSLMHYVVPGALRDSAKAIRGATPKAPKSKPYKSKPSDTLIKIAGSQLHDRSRWPELQKLNPSIRDPRAKIKPNTSIRLS